MVESRLREIIKTKPVHADKIVHIIRACCKIIKNGLHESTDIFFICMHKKIMIVIITDGFKLSQAFDKER